MKGNYKLKWHKFTIYFALFTLTAITLFAAVPFFYRQNPRCHQRLTNYI